MTGAVYIAIGFTFGVIFTTVLAIAIDYYYRGK